MINFDAVDFSVRRPEEVISSFDAQCTLEKSLIVCWNRQIIMCYSCLSSVPNATFHVLLLQFAGCFYFGAEKKEFLNRCDSTWFQFVRKLSFSDLFSSFECSHCQVISKQSDIWCVLTAWEVAVKLAVNFHLQHKFMLYSWVSYFKMLVGCGGGGGEGKMGGGHCHTTAWLTLG